MANVGYATLSITPSLRGLQRSMQSQLGGVMPPAGRRAGQQLGRAISAATTAPTLAGLRQAQAAAATAVGKASGTLEKARITETASAARVAAAEANLEKVRGRSGVTQAQLTAAEARVTAARTNHQAATAAVTRAETALTSAQNRSTEAVKNVRVATDQARVAQERARVQSIAAVSAAQQLALTQSIAANAAQSLGGRMRGALTGIVAGTRTVGSSIKSHVTQRMQSSGAAASSLGASFKSMAGVASGAMAAIGISNVIRDIGSMGMSIQDTTANLTGLYGNAQLATSTVSTLNSEFGSSRLGAEVFHNAAVSLGYLGVEGDDAVGIMRNIRTSVDALGGGPAQVDSITSALTKAQNQGNAFNGELNMISEAGFPIFSELQNHLGKTEAEIKSMASQGEISLDHLLAVLDEPTSEAFAKAQDAAAELENTFKSRFTAAKNAVLTQLGEMTTGALDRLAPMMERIGDAVQNSIGRIPDFFARAKSAMDRYGVTDALRDIYAAAVSLARVAAPIIGGFAAGMGAAFGAILVALRPVFRLLTSVGEWMQNNESVVRNFGVAVGVVAGAFAAWRAAMAIGGVLASLTNPIGWVALAIGGLVAALTYAWQESETFRAVVTGAWRIIQAAATTAGAVITGVLDHLRDETTLLGGIWSTIWGGIQTHFSIIWGAIVEAWESGVQIFTGLWDVLQGILTGDWERAWSGAKDVALGAWSLLTLGVRTIGSIIWNYLKTWFIELPQNVGGWLRENIPVIVEALAEWWESFKDWIVETGPKIVDQLWEWGAAIGNWLANDAPPMIIDGAMTLWNDHIRPWFEALPGRITSAFNNVQRFQQWLAEYGPTLLKGFGIAVGAVILGIPALILGVGMAIITALGIIAASITRTLTTHLRNAATEAFAAMRQRAGERATALVTWFRELPSRIWTALSRLPQQMRTIGGNIITGILNGITGNQGRLFSRMRNLASNALSAARTALGISSPSRVFRDEVGAEVIAGLLQGLERGQVDVDRAMRDLVNTQPAMAVAQPAPPRSGRESTHEQTALLAELLRAVKAQGQHHDVVVQVDSQEIARATQRGQRQLARR